MTGRKILHYSILEELGRGGMGVVYKAEDIKLERTVAIKFLPQQISGNNDSRKRFKIEAKAAAGLNHHNIATVYSIEETENEMFIVMEFVDGIELKEKIKNAPIQTGEIIDISTQIAEGLKIAHNKGIIHRDIKSSNIMLRKDDVIKIMDFGLARIKGGTELTKLGTTLGTTFYMSPEQTKGETVDHRTDIWSFGVLLYQMLTGEYPFKGDYDQAVVYSILNEDLPPLKIRAPNIPHNMESVVQKMLKKNPEERYNNLGEFIEDLQSSAADKVFVKHKLKVYEDVPSIAILPFKNTGGDEEDEYFNHGLTEDITDALTYVHGLKVVASTSTFSINSIITDYKEIGKILNVKTVLEGSIKKSKYNFLVNVRLINVEDGFYLWSEQYNRVMEDVFAVQDEIILSIVEKLKIRLLRNERSSIVKRHVKNCEAFNWYLKGRYFLNYGTFEGNKMGIECFEKAIKIEPNYALPYAGIANANIILGSYYYLPAIESFPNAIEAARKAIKLNISLAEAYYSIGCAIYEHNWDWEEAEKAFLKGLKINPGLSFGHADYACFLLMLARFEEAQKEILLAKELDPLGLNTNAVLGYTYFVRRDYDTALNELNRTLELDPDSYRILEYISKVYEQKGQLDKALKNMKRAYDKSDMNPCFLAELGHTYALSGNRKEALIILDQLREKSKTEFISASNFATVYLGLNDTEKIFYWLEKSFEEKAPFVCYLKVDPRFDKIRSDERFNKMLKRANLL